jgi:hypothetical protein
MTPAPGSVEIMHEAGGDAHGSAEDAGTELTGVARIEALPLAERAPSYQAVADRLRAELERSDPSRGDLAR